LKSHADVVLFDSPPSQIVSDALILGSRVDGVLLVNQIGATRSKDASIAVEDLRRVQVNLLGVVLNREKLKTRTYYYYGYSSHPERTPKPRGVSFKKNPLFHFWGNGNKPEKTSEPPLTEYKNID
jgi:Mrp family chromosome partitioning ATPase